MSETAINPPAPEDPVPEEPVTESVPVSWREDLAAIVHAALAQEREIRAKEQEAHAAQIKTLTDQVTGLQSMLTGTVVTGIPEHSAGNGTEVAETWSQWEQELAHAAAEAARRVV